MNSSDRLKDFIISNLPDGMDQRRSILIAMVDQWPGDARIRALLETLDSHLVNQREFVLPAAAAARGSSRLGDVGIRKTR